ncbi:uncharacterized protein PV06_07950 [Exophiala oligosperma]|uniref:Uncharacterized protein n=1 Tax=Exophiala oligosperma TaxID=215243 RepID=A0A0D2AL80_9EURO|nr:uncharacterized protein PV06_07950 [Exophiala oligosperma]KIW40776.1 hypothetical protein PV06_07950 [Exophiala oligosperma]
MWPVSGLIRENKELKCCSTVRVGQSLTGRRCRASRRSKRAPIRVLAASPKAGNRSLTSPVRGRPVVAGSARAGRGRGGGREEMCVSGGVQVTSDESSYESKGGDDEAGRSGRGRGEGGSVEVLTKSGSGSMVNERTDEICGGMPASRALAPLRSLGFPGSGMVMAQSGKSISIVDEY